MIQSPVARALPDPKRWLALHLWEPEPTSGLLEIVRRDCTDDQTCANAVALAQRLQKIPALVHQPIVHRLLARYHEAADTVFMDGSTPWEVDEAMVAFGFAMGPYEAQDLTGVDIALANQRHWKALRAPHRRVIPLADRMLELGKLGRKPGPVGTVILVEAARSTTRLSRI